MKTTLKLAIWSIAALLATGFTACKDEPEITGPHITITTTKNPGENIRLYIYADVADQADVWIDLNNNGIKENNEEISSFYDKCDYSFSSKTVTIYGKVKELNCSNNQLTALDVSKNAALTYLECNYNQLKALDVSKNSALVLLYCSGNQLTKLNLSKNTNLSVLVCGKNHLTELNVSKNTALTVLYCYYNQLKALDVSKNSALIKLECYYNQLKALDVSKNTKLEYLACFINNIYDSKMDALVNSLPDRNGSTKGSFYVINTDYGEGNTCNHAQVNIATNKNWKVLNSDGQPYSGSN